MSKLRIKLFLSLFIMFTLIWIGTCLGAGTDAAGEDLLEDNYEESYVKAEVLEVKDLPKEDREDGQHFQEQMVTVKILEGEYRDNKFVARNTLSGSPGWDIIVNPGDKVILYMSSHDDIVDEVHIADIARVDYVTWTVIGFMIVLVIIGGKKGIKSLVSLGLTALAVYKILLPAIIAGKSPIMVTILVMIAVTMLTMFIVGGLNRKSIAATLGTAGGVLIAGILALVIGDIAHLTGFASEESRMLLYVENFTVNMKGLLFAGIIIGALGATMDVAMSIASTIDEVKRANPLLNNRELTSAGMNVGRDIMGTMANTLILAYTGSALPLLLLFMSYDTSAVRLFSTELIATEVVRAMVGSIGLICAMPLTAAIAGILSTGLKPKD